VKMKRDELGEVRRGILGRILVLGEERAGFLKDRLMAESQMPVSVPARSVGVGMPGGEGRSVDHRLGMGALDSDPPPYVE